MGKTRKGGATRWRRGTGRPNGRSQTWPPVGEEGKEVGRADGTSSAAVDGVPGEVEVASADRRDSRTFFIVSCVGNPYPAWTTSRALHRTYALCGAGGSPGDDSPARILRLTGRIGKVDNYILEWGMVGDGCFARTVGGRWECSIGSRVQQGRASSNSFRAGEGE